MWPFNILVVWLYTRHITPQFFRLTNGANVLSIQGCVRNNWPTIYESTWRSALSQASVHGVCWFWKFHYGLNRPVSLIIVYAFLWGNTLQVPSIDLLTSELLKVCSLSVEIVPAFTVYLWSQISAAFFLFPISSYCNEKCVIQLSSGIVRTTYIYFLFFSPI